MLLVSCEEAAADAAVVETLPTWMLRLASEKKGGSGSGCCGEDASCAVAFWAEAEMLDRLTAAVGRLWTCPASHWKLLCCWSRQFFVNVKVQQTVCSIVDNAHNSKCFSLGANMQATPHEDD